MPGLPPQDSVFRWSLLAAKRQLASVQSSRVVGAAGPAAIRRYRGHRTSLSARTRVVLAGVAGQDVDPVQGGVGEVERQADESKCAPMVTRDRIESGRLTSEVEASRRT